MTTDQLVQKFRTIDKKQKIVKLQEILNILKGKLPIFGDIYTSLQRSGSQIDENLLIIYYTMILQNAERLEDREVVEYQNFMNNLREKENQDNSENNINLDYSLNNI